MGTPSAVSSAIATTSLCSGKTYSLDNVDEVNVLQEYAEIDYSTSSNELSAEDYAAAICEMSQDELYISEITNQVNTLLKEKVNDEDRETVVTNVELLSPVYIMICGCIEEVQQGTLEEFRESIKKIIIDHVGEEYRELSKCKLTEADSLLIKKEAADFISALKIEKVLQPHLIECFEDIADNTFNGFKKSFIKKSLLNFVNFVTKNYGDEALTFVGSKLADNLVIPFLRYFGNDLFGITREGIISFVKKAPSFIASNIYGAESIAAVGGNVIKTELNSFVKAIPKVGESMIKKVPGDEAVITNAQRLANTTFSALKSFSGTILGSQPLNAASQFLTYADDGVHIAEAYASSVDDFVNSTGIIKKAFGSTVNSADDFATQLATNATISSSLTKAFGTGVTSLAVTSTVSFAFEAAETFAETGDLGQALVAGGSKVIEDLPKNIAGATGAAVGTVAGSAVGTIVGAAIGGPVGAFVGEKVGGFLGGLLGQALGEAIYNAATKDAEIAEVDKMHEINTVW